MPYRVSLLLSLLVAALFWAGCDKSNDDVDDIPAEPQLVISLPIANVGDQVSFTLTNIPGAPTGYRFDPGDGSGPVSYQQATYYHTYSDPGTYTVSGTYFINNESTTLTATITVEGPTRPAIRIREVELVTLQNPYEDSDVYLNMEPGAKSDPFFKILITYTDFSSTLLYTRSTTKMNTQTGTWTFTTEIPLIYYTDDLHQIQIIFDDDDTNEGSMNDFAGQVFISDTDIAALSTAKPAESQWSHIGTAVNLTVDWID